MDYFYLKYGDSGYDITITEEEVLIGGCDCNETMPDEIIVEVYEKLGEYIKFKGLSN